MLAGLLLCAWAEFHFYPGHTYLEGESQLYVPMLERLQYPGLLGRDLVATHPDLRTTTFDEISLFLLRLEPSASLRQVFVAQQVTGRLALLLGLYLLLTAAAVSRWSALLCSMILALGAWLPGLNAFTVDTEPTPAACAFGFTVLALGLAAGERIVLGALAGGAALLYAPVLAAPFWISALGATLLSPRYRPAMRPLFTIGLIFALLAANLAQLQPGAPLESNVWMPIDPGWLAWIVARAPSAWPASWMAHAGWLYAALTIAALLAVYRLWTALHSWFKPFAIGLPVIGFAAALLTACLAPRLPKIFWVSWQPARFLLYLVTMAAVLFAAAAMQSKRRGRVGEALLWTSGVLVITLSAVPPHLARPQTLDVRQLADWAEAHTWGGSLFLFADAGHQAHPGVFRALSLRPVYVDWIGGTLSTNSRAFAAEWQRRQHLSTGIRAALAEPVDYVVLEHNHRLTGQTPVFLNRDFAVYDARPLRAAPALEDRQ